MSIPMHFLLATEKFDCLILGSVLSFEERAVVRLKVAARWRLCLTGRSLPDTRGPKI